MTAPESRAADLARDNAIYRLISECEGECPNFVDVTAGCTLGEADCQCYQLARASWNAAITTSAAAEAAMREALKRFLVRDADAAEQINRVSRARLLLSLPASAQAERMMRVIEASNALCENVYNNGSHDNWKSLANALRALGETDE